MYCLTKNELIELPISHTTECQKLKILGYLDSSSNLTEKGKQVFDVIENYKSDKKVPPVKNIEEFKDNVSIYREIFPKGVVDGKPLRGSPSEIAPRILWFFNTYPQYTWDHVLKATQSYIDSFGADFTYCKTSIYFIKKEDKNKNTTSVLADWCEAELDELKESPRPILGFNRLV